MKKRNYITVLFVTTILLTSCNNADASKSTDKGDKQQIINTDSIELTTLVRNLYEWHETKYRKNGFPFKFTTPSDSIFIGVDWDAYEKDMEVFRKTNFFSNDFFIKHRAIALSVDSSIKQASIEWRNINDGIPIWDTDADDWCGCQDYPDNYWKKMILNNFKFTNDTVSFKWTWDDKEESQTHQYEMKAKKENGTWRISYIEGFTYYGTVAHYNKIIKPHEKESSL